MKTYCFLLLLACSSQASYRSRRGGEGVYHKHDRSAQRAPVPGEDKFFWNQNAQETLQKQLQLTEKIQQAKNIVFFLGDGMGIPVVTAARIFKGSKTGRWEHETMTWENFPHVAISKPYTTDGQIADSASSATAYLCGVKSNTYTVGVDSNVKLYNCTAQMDESFHTPSIVKWFQDAGRSTGLVTNTRITHATPAGSYAHSANRDWEDETYITIDGEDPDICDDIAEQLVFQEPGKNFKVIMGGGRRHLTPVEVPDVESGNGGNREDGQDLIQAWQDDKASLGVSYSFVWNRDDLLAVDVENTDYLMGLFDSDHMDYVVDRDPAMDPTLPEMTEVALKMLQKDPNGYFLLVEGGRIDHGNHANVASRVMAEALELDEAVQVALNMTNAEDTIVIVTADHSHSLTMNGNPARQTDILGIGDVSDVDGIAITTLLYGNGPGFRFNRQDPSNDNTQSKYYRQFATVPFTSAHHGGEDVAIWATGPHAHLFTGVYEQNYIPHALAYAACVGDGLTFCTQSN